MNDNEYEDDDDDDDDDEDEDADHDDDDDDDEDETAAVAAREDELDPAAEGFAEAADEFEDALEEQDALKETEVRGRLPTFLKVKGQKLYIARLVKSIGLGKEVRKTTVRHGPHGRVAHAAAVAAVAPMDVDDAVDDTVDDTNIEDEDDGTKICVGDHVGALVRVGALVCMVVGEITKMFAPNGAAASSAGLTLDELCDDRSEIKLRPLVSQHVRATTRGGGLGSLWFAGGAAAADVKVAGNVVVPLTLDTKEVNLQLSADIATLEETAKTLWYRIIDEEGAVQGLSKATPAARHLTDESKHLFVMDKGEVAAAEASNERSCPICGVALKSKEHALKHSAMHHLKEPTKLPHAEMCPLCFGPASACPLYIVKTSTLQPRIVCKVYAPTASTTDPERGVKYAMKKMKSFSKTSPSTNHPIVCPACHPELAEPAHLPVAAESPGKKKKKKKKARAAVWSYNMRAHWGRLHATSAMPAGLAAAIALDPRERDALLK